MCKIEYSFERGSVEAVAVARKIKGICSGTADAGYEPDHILFHQLHPYPPHKLAFSSLSSLASSKSILILNSSIFIKQDEFENRWLGYEEGHFVLLPRVSQLARFPQVWSASHNMHKLITTVISLLILFMWSTKQMLHDVFSSLCTKFQLRGAWVASAPVCLSLLPFVESALVKVGELREEPTRNDKLNPFLTGARVGTFLQMSRHR